MSKIDNIIDNLIGLLMIEVFIFLNVAIISIILKIFGVL